MDAVPEASRRGPTAAAISNAVVHVFRERLGKGPTRAKTYLHEDMVSCVLRGGFSVQEMNLVAAGRNDLVENQRRAMQKIISRELIDAVEGLTGRTVEAFMSSNHVDPEISLETFILDARPDDDDAFGVLEAVVETG